MKTISTLFTTIAALFILNTGFSETINSNTSWTVSYNSNYVSNTSFVIASGKTLTLDQASSTLANCTFTGGTIAITQQVSLQGCTFTSCNLIITNANLSLTSNVTSFISVTGTITGTGAITASAPLVFRNSVFTFSGSSSFNPMKQLDLYASTLNFYGNSHLLSTGGPDNLWAGSHLIAGDGTASSRAYLFFNGATLNLEDAASTVGLANVNNYYFNWSSYKSISNSKSYSGNSGINCGASGQNACQNPYTYGPATAGANGISAGFASLPVVLTDFTVALAKNAVTLTWSTQQEINAASTIIERSADGAKWDATGTVAAKGNSSVVSHYTYTDAAALNGIAYYRLKMVDLDGSYTYSDVKLIRSTLVKGISFFPNPATNYVNVSLGETTPVEMSLQLVNLSGQIVLTQKVAAGSNGIVSLPVQQYTRGMYVLQIATAAGVQQSTKLVINH